MRWPRVFVTIATVAVTSLAVAGAIAWGAGSQPTLAAGAPPQGTPDRTFGVHSGVNRLSLSVVQRFGVTPPAILFQTVPAGLDCRVLGYDYEAQQASSRPPPIGTLTMSLKCGRTPRNAAVRLRFRAPIRRVFERHNGPASIRMVLDTPRGKVLPLMELGVRPPSKANCRTLGHSFSRRGKKFELTIRGRCHGLRRGSESVVSIGGLLLDRSASPSSAADFSPLASAGQAEGRRVIELGVRKTLDPSVDSHPLCALQPDEIHSQCTQTLEMWWGRTYSQEYSQDCPVAFHYVPDGGWPGWSWKRVPDVGPSDVYDFAGLWTFTFWGVASPPVKLVLTWTCKLGPPVALVRPTIQGVAVVGRTLHCTPGNWSPYTYTWGLGYFWLRGNDLISYGPDYTPTSADHGTRLTCLVQASNAAVSNSNDATIARSDQTEPVVLGPPRVHQFGHPAMIQDDPLGEVGYVPPLVPRTGARIKCTQGSWDDAFSFSYHWLRNGDPIADATGQHYTPHRSDVGKSLSCRVRATNQAGSTDALSQASGPVTGGGQIL